MSRDINLLYPKLIEIIPDFLEECRQRGLIVKITETYRSKEEQNGLYAKGRTKPGKIVTWVKYPYSNHNWGIAFDVCRNDGKGAYNDSDGWFTKVGAVGEKYGLKWGGRWTTPDRPHFEYTKYGDANALFKKYKTPENFKKTWKKEEVKKYLFTVRNFKYNGKVKAFNVINEKGENYIRVRDLANFLEKEVKYDENTKIISLDDTLKNLPITVNKQEYLVKSIKSNGFNFINARELASALGYDTGYNESSGKVFFKVKKAILKKLIGK